ncbi:VWA domain-containing protein [Corynebacterium sp. MSK297]|uniref:vWA domain-containing protein n=1 Tax=Corynebacterium sp. MSK297 TaxID=3050221 RepID=UPI00254E0D46|nr:vWA domain-containing protein [Corynebacterium sp. MSK297]MDK8846450.1 VWA domain-containing protein [Corynebacterium sp. MSK297]
MGRHYTPEQKTQFSGGFIATVIAVLAAIIALLAWLVLRSDSEDTNPTASGDNGMECIEGDLQLPVASGDAILTQSLLASWNASNPVVRDHCVHAVVADDIARAAVYIDADSPRLHHAITAADRKPAASGKAPKVAGQAAGIYDPNAATDAEVTIDLPADAVAYPGDSVASAVVATVLVDDPEAGAELLLRDEDTVLADADGPAAAVQAMSAQGSGAFRHLEGAYVEYAAVVLNQSDEIDEEQARAAQVFVDDLAEQYHGFESTPEVEGQVEAETDTARLDATAVWDAYLARTSRDFSTAGTTSTHTDTDDQPLVSTDTLFLLDTSDAMAAGFADADQGPSRFHAAADAIASSAPDISATGYSVALWNYSSPLAPGVQQGFRRNIGFSDGVETADSVQLLGTGGVPQTNEALLAAAHAVREYSAGEQSGDKPARIVLIASGTADSYPKFAQQFREAAGNDVELAVLFVGEDEPDAALREVAQNMQIVKNAAELEDSLRRVVGL